MYVRLLYKIKACEVNEESVYKVKDFLIYLKDISEIKDYKHLEYTLKSMLSIFRLQY